MEALIGKYISFSGRCIVYVISLLRQNKHTWSYCIYAREWNAYRMSEWAGGRAYDWTHAHIHQAPALFSLPALSSLHHLSMENVCTEYSTQWTAHCIRLGDLLCLANFSCLNINKTRIHTQQRTLNLKKKKRKQWTTECTCQKKKWKKICFTLYSSRVLYLNVPSLVTKHHDIILYHKNSHLNSLFFRD